MKKFMSLILSAVMFVCATAGTCLSAYAGDPIFGIDVSEHNGVVEFTDVKNDNKDFVMIRLGYYNHLDEKFWDNVKNAYNAKMDFGVYLYSYAYSTAEAKIEADFVISTLSQLIDKGYGEYFTLPVAYDMEDSSMTGYGKAQLTNQMTTFCDAIKNAGYVPMVYSNLNWFTNYIDLNTVVSKQYKIWYAYWENSPDFSTQKTIGTTGVKADMWQYISGSYESETDGFDKNVIYNSEELVKTLPIMNKATASLSTTATYYTGTVKTPIVTVKNSKTGALLKSGIDYDVTMDAGRINVGRYAVKITYKGDYSGSETLYFNIIPKGTDVSGVTVRATGFTVQWATQKTQTTGYQVQYSKNSNFTSATTINMPKPDYYAKAVSGLAKNTKYYVRVRTYTVTKFNGANYTIYSPWSSAKTAYTVTTTATLSTTATYYTGTVKTPGVTVKDSTGRVLKNGTDYTVTQASGRKNVGRYAVKITYKGTYEGVPAQTLYFNIIPRGITGITKVTASSKGFTVQWNTQKTATTGYQIQYSTSSNFANAKTVTMPKNAYYAKKVTGLAGNKKYYVRVRTYTVTKFNGKNYNIYSPWCAVKTVTTK